MDLYKGTVIPASLEDVILGKPNFLFQISTISTFNFNIHTNHSTFHVLKKTFQLATLYDLLEIPDSKVANWPICDIKLYDQIFEFPQEIQPTATA